MRKADGTRCRLAELLSVPTPLRGVVVGLVVALAMSACADGDSSESASEGSCQGRAEFWRAIQQDYLDRLGDAPAEELDPLSARVVDASEWLGAAMVEFVREADAVGCAPEVRAGSALICAGVEQLEPRGGAGEVIVSRHVESCPK